MVVGAGAGGLEAAVTAAMCGHHVELYEKDADIGGQLWIAPRDRSRLAPADARRRIHATVLHWRDADGPA